MVDQFVQSVVDWIGTLPIISVYVVFTLVAYLENVIPPVPGDVLLAFGGYLAADGLLSIPVLWVLTVIASVIGFMNMYWIGHSLGEQINEKKENHFLLRFINYRYFRKGKIWMYKYGQWVIFWNRFLAGTRSVIALTAGMSHIKISPTVINSLISSALWNAILLLMGWVIKDNWQIIGGYLSVYGKMILACIGVAIITRFFWQKRTSESSSKKNQKK